jgi:hypothetical protein
LLPNPLTLDPALVVLFAVGAELAIWLAHHRLGPRWSPLRSQHRSPFPTTRRSSARACDPSSSLLVRERA